MVRYVVKRILASIFVLLVVLTVSLWVTRLAPSNPCHKKKSAATCACLKNYELDHPVFPVYIPPPTDPVDNCSFWQPESVAQIGSVHVLGPSEWGNTQYFSYMGMVLPEIHLISSPDTGMFGEIEEPEDYQSSFEFTPVGAGAEAVSWVVRLGVGPLYLAESALGTYIASENVAAAADGLSAVHAGPGVQIHASLGPSMRTDRMVLDALVAGAPFTLQLGFQALLLALLIGVPAGMYAGLNQNTWSDYTTMTFAMVGVAVPNFVIGPILIYVFALQLGWFDPGGWDGFVDSILPSVTLSLYYAAYIARLTRGGMLEMIRKDFIRTARAKGLREGLVVFRHAFKGTLLPVVSYLGPAFAALLTGSVVVEKIFSIPGIGTRFVESALNRDYNMVLGTVVIYSTLLVALNFVVDILYTVLDPRVSYDEA